MKIGGASKRSCCVWFLLCHFAHVRKNPKRKTSELQILYQFMNFKSFERFLPSLSACGPHRLPYAVLQLCRHYVRTSVLWRSPLLRAAVRIHFGYLIAKKFYCLGNLELIVVTVNWDVAKKKFISWKETLYSNLCFIFVTFWEKQAVQVECVQFYWCNNIYTTFNNILVRPDDE